MDASELGTKEEGEGRKEGGRNTRAVMASKGKHKAMNGVMKDLLVLL